MEVDTAVRRLLLAQGDVTTLTTGAIWRHRLEEAVRPSGYAIVVSLQPWWAASDPIQTNEFPTLWVDCYADPTREDTGEIRRLDAIDKARSLARVVDRHLHAKRGVWWGAHHEDRGVMVNSSRRGGRSTITAGDRHAKEPSLGDTVIERTIWYLDVAVGR